DGMADVTTLASTLARAIEDGIGQDSGPADSYACWSANRRRETVEKVSSSLARKLAIFTTGARSGKRWAAAKAQEAAAQAKLLRDILGNPFRPAAVSSAWLTRAVASLATAAYEDRAMPGGELNPARLAILSDALEEAGCADADI